MQDEDEITIDLREVFFALKRKLFLIILACIAGGGIALAITMFLMTPIYTSTASLLVLSKETTLTSIADIQLGTQLTNDYKVLIRSTSVLEEVIDDLHLDTTPEELKSTISINNPDGTRLLDISVNNSDPEMARDIVNSIASVSSAFIGDKMEVVPPKIIERGKVPEKQTSPSKKRNTLIGILLGLLLSAGPIILLTVLDDTIKSEDDMQNYLGLSMLASIPDRRDFINAKKGKDNKKKKNSRR
ncbi:MAG: polysaccharide export protein [Blautia sp.]|nr:polysaccharide export protein [Blautia sp.]